VSERDYFVEEYIDTENSAKRKINAMSDFGGAATIYEGEKYRVIKVIEDGEQIDQSGKKFINMKLSGKSVTFLCEKFIMK
jgi:hypothetical protein